MKKLVLVVCVLFLAVGAYAQITSGTNWTLWYQVRIKAPTAQGEFNDSIYHTPAEFAKFKLADVDAAVQKRIDNWVAAVSKPPVVVEPTKEDLLLQLEEAQKWLDEAATRVIAKAVVKSDIQASLTAIQATVDKLAAVKATAVVVGP